MDMRAKCFGEDILILGAKIGSPHCVTNWGCQNCWRVVAQQTAEKDTGDTLLWLWWTSFCMFNIFFSLFIFKLHEYPVLPDFLSNWENK